MNIIINPGTREIDGTNEADAKANIETFVEDIGLTGVMAERLDERDHDGRYGYRLTHGEHSTVVDMPGWSIDRVRWMGQSQDIWQFPRLYVDGSSWVWRFAIGVAGDVLTGES
jgi:hypothetical protein